MDDTRMNIHKLLRFYYITDNAGWTDPGTQVNILVNCGITMVQYRNKSYCAKDLDEVINIRKLLAETRIPFIINDDVGLAEKVKADGVHLGQSDTSGADARKRLGKDAIIGGSASTPEELANLDLAAFDYIGCGPVFATTTKTDAKPVIGTKGLTEVVSHCPLPVAAIGGITEENASACFFAGAKGVALISALSRRPANRKEMEITARIIDSATRSALEKQKL